MTGEGEKREYRMRKDERLAEETWETQTSKVLAKEKEPMMRLKWKQGQT